jgi:hypothetical protein
MPNLYSVKKLPNRGRELGDIFFCTSTKETFVCLGDLTLFNLSGLLSQKPVAVVGPQGEPGQSIVGPQGPKGDSIIGPRGPQGSAGASIVGPKGADGLPGPAGKNGRDGRDSTVPGPKGDSIVGPAGPQGPRGDVLIPNADELSAAVTAYRRKHANIQAALLEEISKSKKLRPSTRLHVQNALNRVKREAGL